MHCVGEKNIEIQTKIKLKQIKQRIFMCCCAPDEATAMHELGTTSRPAIIATDALDPLSHQAINSHECVFKIDNTEKPII